MKELMDVLKENAAIIRWLLIAAIVAMMFVVLTASGGIDVMVSAGMAVTMIVQSRTIRSSLVRYRPVVRTLAWAVVYGMYCLAFNYAIQAIERSFALLNLAAWPISFVQATVMIVLPVWLWGRLFSHGWVARSAALAAQIVADAKVTAIEDGVVFEDFMSQPVRLSERQRRRAKRHLVTAKAMIVAAMFIPVSICVASYHSVTSFNTLIVAACITAATTILAAWTLTLVFRVYEIAWLNRGVDVITPEEEFMLRA